MLPLNSQQRGMSLVEVVIVAAVSTIIFGALFFSFKYSLDLINHSRAKLSALSVANDRMEYFRSLPYDDVGVVSGYPTGMIPQNSTTTLNGIEFVERVRVDYVDDAADGASVADTNGIILDYKKIRLEYTWEIGGATSTIQLISNIVPRSIETTAGGGTARINVLDSDSALLPGATVRMFGSSSTFPYDVTTYTDSSGAALFNVPADSGYQVVVTANISGEEYSTAQTYEATTTNPNPVVAPFSVLESDISTLTLQIGDLSDLDITTLSNIDDDVFLEEFNDLLSVASSSEVETVLGDLVLTNTLGVYDASGFAYLGPIAPIPLSKWHSLRVSSNVSVNTAYYIQFFTGAGVGPYTLIPDVDLPGNSFGFSSNIIDLSGLDTGAFPSIFVGITLQTSNTNVTPELDEVSVFYRKSETVRVNTGLDIRGNKIIGTDLSALPIYKYEVSTTTNASGELTLTDLEFDDYTITPTGGFDISSACTEHPFIHRAGVDGEFDMVVVTDALNTLRVSVVDSVGRALPGVSVNLTRPAYDVTMETDNCGQAFFTGGVSANTDYTINLTAEGYTDESVTPFEIDEDTFTSVIMME